MQSFYNTDKMTLTATIFSRPLFPARLATCKEIKLHS